MEPTIIAGIAVSLVFLVVSFVVWFMGHKKASALKQKNNILEEKITSLQQTLGLSTKTAEQVSALTEGIEQYKAREEKLREEITKLTNSLMEEIKKSASMQEISSKLAKNEVVIEGLENTASKNKALIDQLTKQNTEKELIAAENNSVLDQLKEVFSHG